MAHRQRMKSINSSVFPGTQGALDACHCCESHRFRRSPQPDFRVQQQVLDNAQAMASAIMERGYPLVSGGTENHLLLIDLREAPISGKEAEAVLGSAGITVNKNTVPGETRSSMVTSGVRIGTPAMTTRGMGVAESIQVGHWIADVLDAEDEALGRVRGIHELCGRFHLPRTVCSSFNR